ncbi:LLM class flavin-dependent oxidoreductase [Cellulomonas pakistanensis]|uniref:Luciferase-like domain-containing protein n=1 Tax=Cellulomonas pakistanensis TaxID=992287 RepID=A0A919PCB6_9CELL|nr:LLM class flavin-dependent oxidoreductase [Cellulomonas pakistanensis]GIG37051.1 hypothetical protein Cpa01nite_24320 [Cellulomonas pakistanensis]
MAQPVLDRAAAVATRHHPTARPARPAAAPVAAAPAPAGAAPAGAAHPGARPVPPRPTDPAETHARGGAARPDQWVSAPAPVVHVGAPAYGVRTVEARPGSESAIAVAARTADVIRLGFSVAVPSVGALARVTALVEDALAEAGRDRSEVRVLLDLEVVLAGDERTARRKRSHLEYLDALAGLSWAPAGTRVVTTADRLVAEVGEVARRAGVDGVVLHPLAGGPTVEDELRALVA